MGYRRIPSREVSFRSMEGRESVLEAIYEESEFGADEETLDANGLQEDVDMLDTENLDVDSGPPAGDGAPLAGGGDGRGDQMAGGGDQVAGGGSRARNLRRKANKKKNRRKKKGGAASSITDINRFVIDTCRRLKEKKSYLVWNAVGCLGVLAVSDLVKEVEAVQSCGGQKTADGKRFRTGGGILWNILKTREPNAYKEIMAKGREFEGPESSPKLSSPTKKQFRQPKAPQISSRSEMTVSQSSDAPVKVAEELDGSEQMVDIHQRFESSDPKMDRKSVLDRMRVPVAYEDLFEEGEISESP